MILTDACPSSSTETFSSGVPASKSSTANVSEDASGRLDAREFDEQCVKVTGPVRARRLRLGITRRAVACCWYRAHRAPSRQPAVAARRPAFRSSRCRGSACRSRGALVEQMAGRSEAGAPHRQHERPQALLIPGIPVTGPQDAFHLRSSKTEAGFSHLKISTAALAQAIQSSRMQ